MTAAYGKWLWGVGTYSAPLDLVAAMTPVVTFGATMANPNLLAGDMPVAVTIGDASLFMTIGLIGDIAPKIAINGLLAGTVTFGGDVPVNVTMAASGQFGPLWEPSEPCAPVDWEEAELCNG